MPSFEFGIPIIGRETYSVQANSVEEACNILAECDDPQKYLVESEYDWDLGWNRKTLADRLSEYVDSEWDEE